MPRGPGVGYRRVYARAHRARPHDATGIVGFTRDGVRVGVVTHRRGSPRFRAVAQLARRTALPLPTGYSSAAPLHVGIGRYQTRSEDCLTLNRHTRRARSRCR